MFFITMKHVGRSCFVCTQNGATEAVLSILQGFSCPTAESGQVCGNTPNPAGSNLNYGYQGFDNFAMMSLVVFQVGECRD